jgi:hypothetical protein
MSHRLVTEESVYTCDVCGYEKVSLKFPPTWVSFDLMSNELPPARLDIEACHVCAEPFIRLLPELARASRDV